jgi:hypothetical protein
MAKDLEKELEKLKDIPGFSMGVRDNSAMRMIKLMRPVCPNSKIEMEQDRFGNWRAVQKGPDVQNCQLDGGKWWLECEKRGHNPYFRTVQWTTRKPKWETDPDNPDQKVLTGEVVILHEAIMPNIRQTAISPRMNSGRGAVRAIENKGARRLKDFGYEEVCQFRNCQKKVDRKGKSREYGDYCSIYHLSLVAADVQGIILDQVDGNPYLGVEAEKAGRRRQKDLREAVAFAKE